MKRTTVTASASEMQQCFDRYLSLVMDGVEVMITINGKEVGRMVPSAQSIPLRPGEPLRFYSSD